ncbi:rab protein geranylgeranyltransferase component A [Phlyctema vagabunda]|uniref:Rab protein geranylgeranyltransferase component A n=1 Tax=Phlyctema vagabunda TaxID=108571 RepID=A0ABR4PT91_9HELO
MKFLKFVVDYENQTEIWESHADEGLSQFLASQFKLPEPQQMAIFALTLSLDPPEKTSVAYALPRIARHLTSIGVFGPGFGAVVPKWGGGAEIAQVACRAGAVGGGVYVLGTGLKDVNVRDEDSGIECVLSNGETVKTKSLLRTANPGESTPGAVVVSKTVSIVSSQFASIFTTTVEGAPTAAVSVVVFLANTLSVDGTSQAHPVYLMVHSSETGECPAGQSVIYASTLQTSSGDTLLQAAVSAFIESSGDQNTRVLYRLYYEQNRSTSVPKSQGLIYDLRDPSLDLAFDDAILDEVEASWKVTRQNIGEQEPAVFLKFEERNEMNGDDDDSY